MLEGCTSLPKTVERKHAERCSVQMSCLAQEGSESRMAEGWERTQGSTTHACSDFILLQASAVANAGKRHAELDEPFVWDRTARLYMMSRAHHVSQACFFSRGKKLANSQFIS